MAIITAKLSQLRLSPLNTRRVKPSAIDSMADDIAAHGLLQNLVAYEEDDLLWVFAGGRRYRALKELVKRKTISNGDTFPVEVRSKEEAIELSYAENAARQDMHVIVLHGLCSARPVGLHDIDAIIRHGIDHSGGDFLGGTCDGSNAVVTRFVQIGIVPLAQYQRMTVVERVDIHDGEGEVIFVQLEARCFALDDFAEDAAAVLR